MQAPFNTIDVHGIRLEVQRIEGPADRAPLVFLHEGLGSVSLWTQRGLNWPLDVCRAAGRSGLVYSRQGYGQSDPVPDVRGEPSMQNGQRTGRLQPDYMHREALEVLPALLEAVGMQRPVLIGHSDGATIALLHASALPVSGCVAIAPHVLVEDVAIATITQARSAYESGGLRDRLARYHADVDGAFWQWNDIWLSEEFRRFDIRTECRRISAPLLLIQGLEDEYGTLRQLDEIAAVAPHAQQLRLAGCGHSPQRDQPEATRQAITAFLADVD